MEIVNVTMETRGLWVCFTTRRLRSLPVWTNHLQEDREEGLSPVS